MKACFADNAEVPIACAHDIDEVYNCIHAERGGQKDECPYWRLDKLQALIKSLLFG